MKRIIKKVRNWLKYQVVTVTYAWRLTKNALCARWAKNVQHNWLKSVILWVKAQWYRLLLSRR